MPRRVLYDPASPAALAAATLLGEEYDIQPWTLDAAAESVWLTSDPTLVAPDERTRIIGIIDAEAPGPWPAGWYALVPVGAGRPLIARAVENAFASLDASAQHARLERELGELNAIGIQLSAERNLDVLLETILTKAREITGSDAGSLYLVEDAPDNSRRLRFTLAQNDSVEIPFRSVTLPLASESVAGHVAVSGAIVNLADAYEPPEGSPFKINRWFDEHARYRTKSMLVVPLRTPQGEVIGALQLINCKAERRGPLRSTEEAEAHVRPYGERHVRLAGSLASQAAVAIANRRLYESISQLFDGFVKASVTATESRDPTTFGHSFRVADLTVGLAEALERAGTSAFRDVRFSGEELRELRYAALLHDFGKVGVREHVLVKSKKLYPGDLERIKNRIELLMRDLELGVTRRKLTARSWEDHRGRRRTVLTPEEASILAITKGSLTESERREIQQHVVHTFQFLAQIPWTREFRRIPEIARSHHEKLDGSGYPFGFHGDQIPVQSRMMTIADIYDALTATDRPYKKAVRVEEALDTLREEHRAGALDGALLEVFIEARVFERTDFR